MLIIWKVKLHCYKLTSQNTRLAPLALNSPKNILASKSYEDNYICIKIHYFISLFHDLQNWKTTKILELIYFGVCDRPSGLYRPSLSRLPFLWSISTHPGWDNSQLSTHLYACMERSTVRAKWLPQEHNTVSLSRARSLVHLYAYLYTGRQIHSFISCWSKTKSIKLFTNS